MPTTLQLTPLVFARQHGSSGAYAFPIAKPELVARGRDMADATERLARFLDGHLTKIPADQLAAFIYPPSVELLDVSVVLPRADLPRRISIESPVVVPCVVIADKHARWVHVIPLGETVFVPPGVDDLSRHLVAEIGRLVAARELDAADYLKVLPTARHLLTAVDVEITRDTIADLGKRASDRRKVEGDRKKEEARKELEAVGRDLLASAATDPAPVLHRTREIGILAGMLGGDERLCVVLVGEQRAGKSAVLEGLLSQQHVPFRARPVFATSGAQLVAGQSGFGQLAERIHTVMSAAETLDAVVYFDDLGDLLSGEGGSIEDMATSIRPYVVQGRVRLVGELTPEQLEHFEARQVGLFAAMHRVVVEPLDAKQTRDIVAARAQHLRRTEPHRPALADTAVGPLCDLAQRYLSYEAFPGKAVRLAEELRAIHESDVDETGSPLKIGATEVYAAFAARSGIPTFLLRDDRAMRRDDVVEFFRARVIGQTEAVDRIADTLCTVKAGLQPPTKPLANFLFIGPTGVGKTEVAKTLAQFLFGSASRLVRFDMSEYMDPLASERLIRGTERDEGELTRRVRQQPFCVVLLDEIEKAHRAVFDLLLQVCGEGRLSDAKGRTTWFHNAIIIMTSNLGAALRRPSAGFGEEGSGQSDAAYFLEQVQRNFRPEFVNRLDRVIPFGRLDRAQIRQVARVISRRLGQREGIDLSEIDLRITDAALDVLAEAGFSDAYGARALRRHFEDALVGPLAARLSALGSSAKRARLDVLGPGDPEPAPQADLVDLDRGGHGSLRFVFRRPTAASTRDHGYSLRYVAHLRRCARRNAALPVIASMRERREYLVAELASPSGDYSAQNRGAVFDRMDRLLRGVDEAVESIETAEDLCVAAEVEGEDPLPYLEEAKSSYARFERAWVEAVIGGRSADRITLMARPIGPMSSKHRFREFLLGWMKYAVARGWTLTLHRYEDPETDSTWVVGGKWGPPRTPSWVIDALREDSDADLGKKWRAVVMRIQGPAAFNIASMEAGLHRFTLEGAVDHIRVAVLAASYEVDAKAWESEDFAVPPNNAALDAKSSASRVHASDGTVVVDEIDQIFDIAWDDYFDQMYRIHFSWLSARIAKEGEDEWS